VSANQEQDPASTIHGSLLRLRGGRAVAIYLRNGVVSVAELRGERGRILGAGEWGVFHARKLAFAQRRGEVEIVSPIPEEVIAVSVAAVFLISFMKGAFGGGFAIIGIPLLALVMDPITAGALLAPLFCVTTGG
jgi:hypothetical protein